MASWAEVVAFSQPLVAKTGEGSNDNEVTHRPYAMLPVIVWNKEAKRREVVKMRWGLPDPKNWKKLKHIHARAETIDTTRTFAPLFLDGRRGIVLMKTFNETPPENSEQWTVDPKDGRARGFAFLCQGYDIEERGERLQFRACAMVTTPANALLRESILKTDPDPRMPAILEDEDWDVWLGEKDVPIEDVKAVLQTMEGEGWTIAPEPKKEKPAKGAETKAPPMAKRPKGEPEPGLF